MGRNPSPSLLAAFAALTLLASGKPLLGEAGISEMARERAYWLRRPYAMYRWGDYDMFNYGLVKARPLTWAGRHDFFSCPSRMAIEEILITHVARYALRNGVLLAQEGPTPDPRQEGDGGSWAVVDLKTYDGSIYWYPTFATAKAAWEQAAGRGPQPTFLTFDEGLRAAEVRHFLPVAVGLGATWVLPLACLLSSRDRARRFGRAAMALCGLSVAWMAAAAAYWWFDGVDFAMIVGGLMAVLPGVTAGVLGHSAGRPWALAHRWVGSVSLAAALIGAFFASCVGPALLDFLLALVFGRLVQSWP